MTLVEPPLATPYRKFLPAECAVQYLDAAGELTESEARYPRPSDDRLIEMYRHMVLGRRFDTQATALTKQGRLAVYPSSRGQEACQIAAALSLQPGDWLFPTYRDSVALVARGIDPVEVLTLLRGDWHCGYDPAGYRSAPQCTPLATQSCTRRVWPTARRRKGNDTVALAFVGDGATSEGDFHEALNFAAVFKAPVVFLVQNNGYAISVPLARQSAAPTLAHKGVGYGVGSEQVDGNDPVAVLAVLDEAVEHARAGNGPVPGRGAHLPDRGAHQRRRRHPLPRLRPRSNGGAAATRSPGWRRTCAARACSTTRRRGRSTAEAEAAAAALRAGMNADRPVDPMDLFGHVFAEPTPQLSSSSKRRRKPNWPPSPRRTDTMRRAHHGPGPEHRPARRPRPTTTTSSSSARTSARSAASSAITDGLTRRLRRGPVLRHPARRGRHRRLRDRHGDVRVPAGRRDAVRRVRLPGVRADRLPRREDAQPHPGRAVACRSSSGSRTRAASAGSSTTATPARATTRTPPG